MWWIGFRTRITPNPDGSYTTVILDFNNIWYVTATNGKNKVMHVSCLSKHIRLADLTREMISNKILEFREVLNEVNAAHPNFRTPEQLGISRDFIINELIIRGYDYNG